MRNPSTPRPNNPLYKILALSIVGVVLTIPLSMVSSLLSERQYSHMQASQEIAKGWGTEQIISGPALVLSRTTDVKTDKGGTKKQTSYLRILPEALNVKAELFPEVRKKGIYEAILYRAKLSLSAEFRLPAFSPLGVSSDEINWDEAFVFLQIQDPKGLRPDATLKWQGKPISIEAGTKTSSNQPGIRAFTPLGDSQQSYQFTFDATLQGSNSLMLDPSAKNTIAQVISSWPHPSFAGDFLPSGHTISPDGFSAQWEISYLATNRPSVLSSAGISALEGSYLFGAELFQPVSHYSQVDRIIKYAILFVILTFAAFFLFETLVDRRLHPLQYTLVGVALCLFYLLLLALSEHIGFSLAYLAASTMTVLLISYYAKAISGHTKYGALVSLILATLYVYFYVLLQLEDFALVSGSLGLFTMLAATMYLTRNVDWYAYHASDPSAAKSDTEQ